ncbi:HesB/IscA family protein [Methylohalobius crimeensis]|uniref:HesB/IscA family protein n=1 Tax=Methylohalobius crimeensis TaxID=244365 RepID=UPI0003B74542|nr:iron-sulfur cluster assembly accessory protein [Methylohalobius crimeensis]
MLTLTDDAIKAVSRFLRGSEKPVTGLRVSVNGGGCSGLQYSLNLEERAGPEDTVVEFGDVQVFVDPDSMSFLKGIKVDFVEGLDGAGFKFENPKAASPPLRSQLACRPACHGASRRSPATGLYG